MQISDGTELPDGSDYGVSCNRKGEEGRQTYAMVVENGRAEAKLQPPDRWDRPMAKSAPLEAQYLFRTGNTKVFRYEGPPVEFA